jgi:hypothetical protein
MIKSHRLSRVLRIMSRTYLWEMDHGGSVFSSFWKAVGEGVWAMKNNGVVYYAPERGKHK